MRRKWRKIYLLAVWMVLVTAAGCRDEKKEEIPLEEAQTQEDETGSESAKKQEEEKIYVHVCGQVKSPGVYELPSESRVYQALDAAGGMTEEAASQQVNQAQKLADGQQIYVPSAQEAENSSGQPGQSPAADDGKVNLNTADKEELMTLSGIGEARAEAILEYREEKGGFQSVEELKEIDGIKDGIFGKIEDQIMI